MISLTLTQRIWLSFALLLMTVGVLTAVLYPLSIKDTMTDETYRIIEAEQERLSDPQAAERNLDKSIDFIERRNASRSVGHIMLINQYYERKGDLVPENVLAEMGKKAYKQKKDRGHYELTYRGAVLFYVISKSDRGDSGENVYYISYMWDTYRDHMVNRLWQRLVIILLLTGLLAVIPAIWLARYLRSPLKILGRRFEQIAQRNWQEQFYWKSEDEFKVLSLQFEKMRQNLLRHDAAQKTFIQHASHELKTPLMTIKSYAQSVKDGILPKTNVEGMMDVILGETKRMEKRVQNMLYYTKLDAVKFDALEKEDLRFGDLCEEIIERFQYLREDISFHAEGEDVHFMGDREQWTILLENLVQNAIRYARASILIKAEISSGVLTAQVFNDGEKLTSVQTEELFQPFRKGSKGQFGLGLAIVKRIAELHGGTADALNTEHGVVFRITVPFVQSDREEIK
ncbi:ATP-binding protein [Fictibacillus aquaticus]|uniref:histidine kinase n=1 Tax=Fictibacillus aquaticus TaxID=2021314 RepID=A0A235F6D3_9BACL|nr:HAMP domain-containing sensor histidine kinase [Fictibacillus aquaticus]OYD56840.1 two-component sensor histidine kinase [Fictibacillus aquaticus]